jgi:hypothetical protein
MPDELLGLVTVLLFCSGLFVTDASLALLTGITAILCVVILICLLAETRRIQEDLGHILRGLRVERRVSDDEED